MPFEIKWEAPEFEYRAKNVSWYWLSIILAILILGFAIWQKNFLFGIFVVLAEILIMVWGNRLPRALSFKLNEEGFEIVGEKFYPYREIETFSIDDLGSEVYLVLRLRRPLKPIINIRLPKGERGNIENALRPFLTQSEPQQSLLDDLEKFLRF